MIQQQKKTKQSENVQRQRELTKAFLPAKIKTKRQQGSLRDNILDVRNFSNPQRLRNHRWIFVGSPLLNISVTFSFCVGNSFWTAMRRIGCLRRAASSVDISAGRRFAAQLSCFEMRAVLQSSFYQRHANSASMHPSEVFHAARTAVHTVRMESPTVSFDSADQLHEAIPDLAMFVVQSISRVSRDAASHAGVPTLDADEDLVQYFLTQWLPRYVHHTHSDTDSNVEGSMHVRLGDVCAAVESLRRFLASPMPLDSGRFAMRPQPGGLWVPHGKEEEAVSLPLLWWLQDECPDLFGGGDAQQRVLQVGCGSGYMTDMLLKGLGGRMASLLCADHSSSAIAMTENTIQEHWRLRRSSHVGKMIEVCESECMPLIDVVRHGEDERDRGKKPSSRTATAGSTNLAAAARRRKQGRAHRSGMVLEQDRRDRTSVAPNSLLTSKVDLICLSAAPVSVGSPVWSAFEAIEQQDVIDHNVPYTSVAGLQRWVSQCVSTSPQCPLAPGGVVCALLPFMGGAPKSGAATLQRSLGNIIAAQLASHNKTETKQHWEVLTAKRTPLCSPHEVSAYLSSPKVKRFLHHCGPRDPLQAHRFEKELQRYVSSDVGSELVVFSAGPSTQNLNSSGKQQHRSAGTEAQGKWEDSFEHQYYLPKEGPTNPFHWTNQAASFPHLDVHNLPQPEGNTGTDAMMDPEKRLRMLAQRNDPSASLGRSPTVMRINEQAEYGLKTIFGHELRARRAKRARKLAFASPRNAEWYLDEKVVKSDAGKVEVLNEVLKKFGDATVPR